MIVPKPLRILGMIVCVVLIVLPAAACLRGLHAEMSKAIEVLLALIPFTLFVLAQLCIAEGRARERANREQRERG